VYTKEGQRLASASAGRMNSPWRTRLEGPCRALLAALFLASLLVAIPATCRAQASAHLIFAHGYDNNIVNFDHPGPTNNLYLMPHDFVTRSIQYRQPEAHGAFGFLSAFPTAMAAGPLNWYFAEYDPARDHSRLYRSTSYNSVGHVVYEVDGYTIDALTLGSFRDSGGYKLIVGLNGTRGQGASVWAFDTYTDSPRWSPLYGFNTYWKIGALAAGHFGPSGYDRLAYGFNAANGSQAGIWVCDYAFDTNPSSPYSIYGGYQITALAAGDFNGSGRSDLVAGLGWTDGVRSASSLWRFDGESATRRALLNANNTVWNYGKSISSLTTGRFSRTTDELFVGRIDAAAGGEIYYAGAAENLPNWTVVRNLYGPNVRQRLHVVSFVQ
jgi:hypothetical protein